MNQIKEGIVYCYGYINDIIFELDGPENEVRAVTNFIRNLIRNRKSGGYSEKTESIIVENSKIHTIKHNLGE